MKIVYIWNLNAAVAGVASIRYCNAQIILLFILLRRMNVDIYKACFLKELNYSWI